MVVVVGLVGERGFHIINCDVKDTSHEHALLLWILMKIDTWLIFTDVNQVEKKTNNKHPTNQTILQIAVYAFWGCRWGWEQQG